MIISEMSWFNIFQRTNSDFCASNNFQGSFFVSFSFHGICPSWSYESYGSYRYAVKSSSFFQMQLSMCLVLAEKELWKHGMPRNLHTIQKPALFKIRESIVLFFVSWGLALYNHIWVGKVESFPIILACQS